MIRLIALVAIPLTIVLALTTADTKDGMAADGRYAMKQVEGGFLRLDTRTGRVSFCSKPGPEWVCDAVEDDMAAINKEFDSLTTENAELKDRMQRLQGGKPVTPDTDAGKKTQVPQLRLPTDEEMDRVMAMFNDAMRRFMDMIHSWQNEQDREKL